MYIWNGNSRFEIRGSLGYYTTWQFFVRFCILVFPEEEANSPKGEVDELEDGEDTHAEKETKIAAQAC